MADLNVNSISNAAENGAPDFSHMPTVAGAPVVESGSNSDGEWTRFADGTQHCSIDSFSPWTIPLPTPGGGKGTWTYPLPFTIPPSVSATPIWVVTLSDGNVARDQNAAVASLSATTAIIDVSTIRTSGQVNLRANLIAHGRWK